MCCGGGGNGGGVDGGVIVVLVVTVGFVTAVVAVNAITGVVTNDVRDVAVSVHGNPPTLPPLDLYLTDPRRHAPHP